MAELTEGEQRVYACSQCGGLYAEVAEVNQLLLHAGLPGLASMGGRVDPAAAPAPCRECQIDLNWIEGGPRHDSLHYERCEGCGRVFIEPGEDAPADLKSAHALAVAFFRAFQAKRSAPPK